MTKHQDLLKKLNEQLDSTNKSSFKDVAKEIKDAELDFGNNKKLADQLLACLEDDKMPFTGLDKYMDPKNPCKSIDEFMKQILPEYDPKNDAFSPLAGGALAETFKKMNEGLGQQKQIENIKFYRKVLIGVGIVCALLILGGVAGFIASAVAASAGIAIGVGAIGVKVAVGVGISKAAVIGCGCAIGAGVIGTAAATLGFNSKGKSLKSLEASHNQLMENMKNGNVVNVSMYKKDILKCMKKIIETEQNKQSASQTK